MPDHLINEEIPPDLQQIIDGRPTTSDVVNDFMQEQREKSRE